MENANDGFRTLQELNFDFAKLLADLSQTWTTRDIAYVQDIVSHAEYGEALENLVAIGQRNGKGPVPASFAGSR
jgi:hypothetical protein